MTPSQIQLWSHQSNNVEGLLDLLLKRQVAADSSETGTGKTVTALETVQRFGLQFVIICPKSVKSHWKTWTLAFGEGMPKCLGVFGWEETKIGKHPSVYKNGLWFRGGREYLVVLDEAHRAKNAKSLNSKMVRQASEQGIYLLLLSATLVQSCLDLSGLAYPLKLITRQSYWFGFARQFGAWIHPHFGGYDDRSSSAQQLALAQLLDRVRVRTRRDEIRGVLGVITQADLVDSSQLRAIRATYEELDRKVRELEALKANAIQIVTERLRARQMIELLKTPVFVEQALEHLEARGNKVVLFFNFTESVDTALFQLEKAGILAGRITGESSSKERDAAVTSFQAHDGPLRALVVNIAAGGEGINLMDLHGDNPRIALLSPPESSSVLVQALGRIGGRIGAKSVGLNRILFVAGTVEEEVHKNVKKKVRRLELLNDGDLNSNF